MVVPASAVTIALGGVHSWVGVYSMCFDCWNTGQSENLFLGDSVSYSCRSMLCSSPLSHTHTHTNNNKTCWICCFVLYIKEKTVLDVLYEPQTNTLFVQNLSALGFELFWFAWILPQTKLMQNLLSLFMVCRLFLSLAFLLILSAELASILGFKRPPEGRGEVRGKLGTIYCR